MPRSRNLRRRPSTPDLHLAQTQQDQHLTADPTSPPETPTTSPPASRKHSLKPRRQPDFRDIFKPLNEDPNIKPVGNGHQFSYQPTLGPEQLSPRSSSSSSSSDLDDSDDASSQSVSSDIVLDAPAQDQPPDIIDSADEMADSESSDDSDSDSEDDSDASDEAETSHLTATTTTVICNFVLEDVDPMDSECEGLDILHPTEIESNRSRSRSRHKEVPKELDKDMMQDLKNLNCSNETSDNEVVGGEADYDFDEEAFLRRREQLRKFRRMSMGSSFGKRTHSELSDSDNDDEALDVNDVGSSARRLRRKMQRTSLLFHDPPPARIEELDEPDSSEDECLAGRDLARELPYWDIEIMEMDSS
ncbi:hypothetical protein G7Z17_g5641 [Cylindrodendrum hubeiense]|uniref:Uncharacterized protein n=1 Tax=Cylindrodendrum hubeiense TaxID=595255 RepID=A0A9P5HAI0_9HYPO|nr:hypothetical protein G7Z17_g5641 [Cylindrodendrum hubeiense]